MLNPEFGRYRLIAELGQGGMADVYLAVLRGPEGVHKLVVVKCLRRHLADDSEFVTMLMDEARLATRMNHANVVQFIELGEIDGQYFMAMEYLDGQPLNRIQHRAAKAAGMPAAMQYRILVDALSGLHYAHELADYDGSPLHVVHRDATPHNIFVTYSGHVKVVDFGIAKASRRKSETRTGVVKGKVTYMSPEQARGGAIDRRADLFSIGVMLWEAASGLRMWKGQDELIIVRKLIEHDYPTSPLELNPSCPEDIDRICRRALAPNPADRFETAAEMQQAIVDALKNLGEDYTNTRIGTFVTELFADKRKEVQVIIERQLANLESTLSIYRQTTSIPALPISSATGSTSLAGQGVGVEPALPPPPLPPRIESSSEPAVVGTRRSRTSSAMMLVAGVAAAVGVTYLVSSRPPAPAASPPEVPTAAPAQPELTRVEVRATPPEATIFIDGAQLPTNQTTSNFARDGIQHQVRAEAPGYVTETRLVAFDAAEVTVELKLEPERHEEASDDSKVKTPSGRTTSRRQQQQQNQGAPSAPPEPSAPPAPSATAAAPTPSSSGTATLERNPWSKPKLPELEKENIWKK